jgi:chaperone required for assembly of F1-ATPase
MINAVFGKTIENLRKRIHVEIVVGNEKRVEKLIASSYFAAADVIQPDNMVAVKLNIKKILYDKPIYVGFSFLELCKLWMFQMHYDFVKQRVPDSILMFTDTDSLIYYNPTDSLEEFVKRLQDKLDTSNIPDIAKKLNINPNLNKMVPGFFKIEIDNNDRIQYFSLWYPKCTRL